ncbi:unannotated protein [freshwater metagenome]|uniref:Unannotated protein n=1 Tax=freshwater metagenome TaxID=449393 RepID=A0A6J7JYM8_9ZZZZ
MAPSIQSPAASLVSYPMVGTAAPYTDVSFFAVVPVVLAGVAFSAVDAGAGEGSQLAVPPAARTFTVYSVPLVNPLITMGLASDPGDTVTHVVPPSVEYSYVVRLVDMHDGAVTYTDSDPLPGTIVEIVGAVSASPPSVMTHEFGALDSVARAASAAHVNLWAPKPSATLGLTTLPDQLISRLS